MVKRELIGKQAKKRRGEYYKCETCGKEFYVYPSEIRRTIKRGGRIRYCSMSCYDKTGENNPFWGKKHNEESITKMVKHPNRPRFGTGQDNPNFIRFGEDYGFLGSRKNWWREKLFRDIGKCELCGFADQRALTMHHKDRNQSHNKRDNLQLLCWNCHAIIHHEEGTGMYHFMRRRNDKRWIKRKENGNGY